MADARRKCRIFWTKEEDDILIREVAKHGTNKWTMVAQAPGLYPRRSAKSCSLRWRANLDPNIQTNRERPFTDEEKRILIDAQARLGNRWYDIAKLLPGRSNTAVKTWWYSSDNPTNRSAKKRRRGSTGAPSARRRRLNSDSGAEDEEDYNMRGSEDEDGGATSYSEGEEEEEQPPRSRRPAASASGSWRGRGHEGARGTSGHPRWQYSEAGYRQYSDEADQEGWEQEQEPVEGEYGSDAEEPEQQQPDMQLEEADVTFLMLRAAKPRSFVARPRGSHSFAVLAGYEVDHVVDQSNLDGADAQQQEDSDAEGMRAAAQRTPLRVAPVAQKQAAPAHSSPRVIGGLDALLAAVDMAEGLTDTEEQEQDEQRQQQQQLRQYAAEPASLLLLSEEKQRQLLAAAAAARAAKLARQRQHLKQESEEWQPTAALQRSPARKTSPMMSLGTSLVPPPRGLAAISTKQQASSTEEGAEEAVRGMGLGMSGAAAAAGGGFGSRDVTGKGSPAGPAWLGSTAFQYHSPLAREAMARSHARAHPSAEGAGDSSGHPLSALLLRAGVAGDEGSSPTRSPSSYGSQGSRWVDSAGGVGADGSPNLTRVFWTKEEDDVLIAAVAAHGTGNWTQVASTPGLHPSRTGKACSLRWREHLDPAVQAMRLKPFTPAEQALVLEAQERWGNRWHHIATLLPGRTSTAIKNWWYSPQNPRYAATPRSRHQDGSPRSTSSGDLARPSGVPVAASPWPAASAVAASAVITGDRIIDAALTSSSPIAAADLARVAAAVLKHGKLAGWGEEAGVKAEPALSSPGLNSSSGVATAVALPGFALAGVDGAQTAQSRLAALNVQPRTAVTSAHSPPQAHSIGARPCSEPPVTPRRGPIGPDSPLSPRTSPSRADSALTHRSGASHPAAGSMGLSPHQQQQLLSAARQLQLPLPGNLSPSAQAGCFAAYMQFMELLTQQQQQHQQRSKSPGEAAAGEAQAAAAAAAAAVLGRTQGR